MANKGRPLSSNVGDSIIRMRASEVIVSARLTAGLRGRLIAGIRCVDRGLGVFGDNPAGIDP